MEDVKMTESYFELNVVRTDLVGGVSNDERIRFHALVEAENEMMRISKNPKEYSDEPIFCFIIREFPFDVMVTCDDDNLSERVYLPDGLKMDERLFPSGCILGVYYGRLLEQIRFKPTDAVKVLDLEKKQLWTGFVYAVPPAVDKVKEYYKDSPYRLCDSDDCYTILDRPLSECKTDDDYVEVHSHVSALRVFRM